MGSAEQNKAADQKSFLLLTTDEGWQGEKMAG